MRRGPAKFAGLFLCAWHVRGPLQGQLWLVEEQKGASLPAVVRDAIRLMDSWFVWPAYGPGPPPLFL
jgi:hypothetical protein